MAQENQAQKPGMNQQQSTTGTGSNMGRNQNQSQTPGSNQKQQSDQQNWNTGSQQGDRSQRQK